MILWILHYVGLILELFQKHTRRSPEPSLFSNVLKTGRRFCTLLVLNATPIQYSYYLWFALDCLIYSLHDFHKQGLLFRVWHCLYTGRGQLCYVSGDSKVNEKVHWGHNFDWPVITQLSLQLFWNLSLACRWCLETTWSLAQSLITW